MVGVTGGEILQLRDGQVSTVIRGESGKSKKVQDYSPAPNIDIDNLSNQRFVIKVIMTNPY